MRSRKSFPAIFAQKIEREISALEAAGSLWRLGKDRRGLERRSAGPDIMGFRIMTSFPILHSLFPLGGKYLCLALAAGAHWPCGLSSPSMCIPKSGPVKGDKQGYSLTFVSKPPQWFRTTLGRPHPVPFSPLLLLGWIILASVLPQRDVVGLICQPGRQESEK